MPTISTGINLSSQYQLQSTMATDKSILSPLKNGFSKSNSVSDSDKKSNSVSDSDKPDLSAKTKSLYRKYTNKEHRIKEQYDTDKQRLEAEYQQKKQKLEAEYQREKQALGVNIYA